MIKNYKTISIIIATLNAERTLSRTLDSIYKQSFNKKEVEILIVDGGSIDDTLSIAKKYKCEIIENQKKLPAYAKYLGFVRARGKYIVYIDADEMLKSNNSLKRKISVFKKYPQVKAVISSGYITPKNSSFTCAYINEFGDPFSKFIYNLSKDHRFFLKNMIKEYGFIDETDDVVILDLSKRTNLPIIELVAMASMVEKRFFERTFSTIKNQTLIPHLFYLLNRKGGYIGIMKRDKVVHYSSENPIIFIRKIRSRVINNIFYKGKEGFMGRSEYMTNFKRMKKYLFVPYSLSLIFPFIDSLQLSISRSDYRYLLHASLTLVTSLMILYYSILKIMGINPLVKGYGE